MEPEDFEYEKALQDNAMTNFATAFFICTCIVVGAFALIVKVIL